LDQKESVVANATRKALPGRAVLGFVLAAAVTVLPTSTCSGNTGKNSTGPATFRVSVGANDLQADNGTQAYSVSSDGRFVAFATAANNLALNPTPFKEIFLKDRTTGSVTNISRLFSVFNQALIGDCDHPAISPDGRYVAFESLAVLYGSETTPQTIKNIFVRDTTNLNLIYRVATGTGNTWPNADCTSPSIARNGGSVWVAFQSSATNLVGPTGPVPGGNRDIYALDILAGTAIVNLVSHVMGNSLGYASGLSQNPRISADGSTVAFASTASLTGAAAGTFEIFIGSPTAAGNATLVSSLNGTGNSPANADSLFPTISSNGRFVAWSTGASNIGYAGGSGHDLVVRDMTGQTTLLVATNAVIFFGIVRGIGDTVGMSDDAQFFSYTDRTDVQIHFVSSGGNSVASVSTYGAVADQGARNSWLSPDGAQLFFTSVSDNLVIGDTNGSSDVFCRQPMH
jgi:Tol biopolymer transport system component